MAWVLLLIAGVFEIGLAIGLKLADGFTKPGPTVLALVSGGIGTLLLTLAMRNLSAGTAYAVWTGIGATGTVVFGVLFLGESTSAGRLVAIACVIVGIVGLKFTES